MPENINQKYDAQNPLILRCHRLMEAFAKSDDERDFYLDRIEGFILFANLDKTEEELTTLEKEIESGEDRYFMIPKLTFFETKKIMEGFVNEKVYDIDTKEKLFDIIQSKEAREHFLEFIYDHHSELEKWQLYYQERSRIRIIEWLRTHNFHFVFEEDLELSTGIIEKLKENLFEKKVGKDIQTARKVLISKAKTYYSNEALNPRPKRGRPPKQIQKLESEPQITTDIYTTVPASVRPFLFTPDFSSALEVTFSSRFETGQEILAHRKQLPEGRELESTLNNINQKLAALRQLSGKWIEKEKGELVSTETSGDLSEGNKLIGELKEEEAALFKKLDERRTAKENEPAASSTPPVKKVPIEKKEIKKINVRNNDIKAQSSTEKAKAKPAAAKSLPKDKAKASPKSEEKKKAPEKQSSPKSAPKKIAKKVPEKPKPRLLRKTKPNMNVKKGK